MWEILSKLFDTTGFPPRWHCGRWSEELGWLHILSDLAIFASYTAIPCVLASFTLRRRDLPFPRIIWLFVAFIFACGTTHLVEAVIFWQPVYRFSGVVKLVTALVSGATVLALIRIVPQVLHLPGLAKLNEELRTEVTERRRVEAALRMSEEKLAALLASEQTARADAERANRTKDEFLSIVSHELRTPLNAILGYTQLLLLSPQDPDTRQGLAVIERNAKAQAKLIEDLLDMSRILASKIRLSITSVDYRQAIQAAVETLQPMAADKGISLETSLDPASSHILADASRLQQMVGNLLSNAVKFTPEGGHVRLELKRGISTMDLIVTDNGEGIAADRLSSIFDRFEQGDSSTTRRHGGLGLGLAIVKQLAELQGGTITAASDGPGRGASFTLRLPLPPGPTAPTVQNSDVVIAAPEGQPVAELQNLRLLVVDDDADSAELLRQLLHPICKSVEVANSVSVALASIAKRPPDLVLSDIGMPCQDGYDLVRALRAHSNPKIARIPAVAVTAFARTEDRQRALAAGFQAHLAKPIDANELASVIARILKPAPVAASPLSEGGK